VPQPVPDPQLSRQTNEWWRWVLVRIYDSSVQISDDNDTSREEFVDTWSPDLFDWGGDQRWNVREWARCSDMAPIAYLSGASPCYPRVTQLFSKSVYSP
jgi:hypothetical protein